MTNSTILILGDDSTTVDGVYRAYWVEHTAYSDQGLVAGIVKDALWSVDTASGRFHAEARFGPPAADGTYSLTLRQCVDTIARGEGGGGYVKKIVYLGEVRPVLAEGDANEIVGRFEFDGDGDAIHLER